MGREVIRLIGIQSHPQCLDGLLFTLIFCVHQSVDHMTPFLKFSDSFFMSLFHWASPGFRYSPAALPHPEHVLGCRCLWAGSGLGCTAAGTSVSPVARTGLQTLVQMKVVWKHGLYPIFTEGTQENRNYKKKIIQTTKHIQIKNTRAALWDFSFFPVTALSEAVFLCHTNIFFSPLSSGPSQGSICFPLCC